MAATAPSKASTLLLYRHLLRTAQQWPSKKRSSMIEEIRAGSAQHYAPLLLLLSRLLHGRVSAKCKRDGLGQAGEDDTRGSNGTTGPSPAMRAHAPQRGRHILSDMTPHALSAEVMRVSPHVRCEDASILNAWILWTSSCYARLTMVQWGASISASCTCLCKERVACCVHCSDKLVPPFHTSRVTACRLGRKTQPAACSMHF